MTNHQFHLIPTAPAQPHSSTSKEAARAIEPRLAKRERAIRAYLEVNGPSTDEEIQDGLRLTGSYERPGRIALMHKGVVEDTGETRRTKSGRRAVVWGVRESE